MWSAGIFQDLTLVLPRGWLPPPWRFVSGRTKMQKSDPGHRGHLVYILCSHFDEKKPGVPPKIGVGWAVKVRRWGVVATSKYFKSPFWKISAWYGLKLSGHVRITISLLYKQKTGWNSDIWNFFSEKYWFFSILVCFHWKSAFWVRPCLKTSLWRHTLTDFHDFGINGKKRPYPIPWYQAIILWARQFQVHKGVVTTPLGTMKPCYKKGLVGRGLRSCFSKQVFCKFHYTNILWFSCTLVLFNLDKYFVACYDDHYTWHGSSLLSVFHFHSFFWWSVSFWLIFLLAHYWFSKSLHSLLWILVPPHHLWVCVCVGGCVEGVCVLFTSLILLNIFIFICFTSLAGGFICFVPLVGDFLCFTPLVGDFLYMFSPLVGDYFVSPLWWVVSFVSPLRWVISYKYFHLPGGWFLLFHLSGGWFLLFHFSGGWFLLFHLSGGWFLLFHLSGG